ncbi:hypothetical protein PT974_10804 [Cladobotryum mycophilum]|uniref:Stc1 domain-containing protein n=1 Tax=Cladobotryum mycophilum TaxID=491253 RepID=A0ABR0SAV6_9HYPO
MDSKQSSSKSKLAAKRNVPHRFRCKVGKEWKEIGEFSTAQQRLIQTQIELGRPIDAAHSGMTCKDHTSDNRSELTCEVCGLTKDLDEFSKNSRRNGVYNCKRCVAWIETQEPDVTPAPLETGHISAEEQRKEVWKGNFVDSTDFFSDDIRPQAPVTDAGSLGLDDLANRSDVDLNDIIAESTMSSGASVTGSSVSVATSSHKSLPPHLQAKMGALKLNDAQSHESKAVSSAASSTTGRSVPIRNLPPHLRAKWASAAPSGTASTTSDGNVDGSGSVSTATTLREEKENEKYRRVAFNAWDSSGRKHHGIKAPTTATVSSSSVSGESGDLGWEASGPINQPVIRATGKAKWAKASECRIPQAVLKRQMANAPLATRCVDPKMDREKPQTFCEPDDDDDIYDP